MFVFQENVDKQLLSLNSNLREFFNRYFLKFFLVKELLKSRLKPQPVPSNFQNLSIFRFNEEYAVGILV